MPETLVDSPVGVIQLVSDGGFLISLTILNPAHEDTFRREESGTHSIRSEQTGSASVLSACVAQLDEYFAGTRKGFDLPVSYSGTAFQQQVWHELSRIPYGHTLSYGQLAQRIGHPQAARAVGRAVGANPIAIVLPCHRVLARTGKLTGFSTGSGISTKKLLLDREGIVQYHV